MRDGSGIDRELDVIDRQRRQIEELEARIATMTATLLLIREWHMPRAGYAADRGSNGERDYMRRAAERALDWKP